MEGLLQKALEAIGLISIRMVGPGFVLVVVGIAVFYLPRVVRFKLYLRKNDRVASDLAGGMNPWSSDGAQSFRQYFALEHYKLLRDPQARALADKVMSAEKTLTRLAWLVLWTFIVSLVSGFTSAWLR